jgi:hypothetical protein
MPRGKRLPPGAEMNPGLYLPRGRRGYLVTPAIFSRLIIVFLKYINAMVFGFI